MRILTFLSSILLTALLIVADLAIQQSRQPQYYVSSVHMADMVVTMEDGQIAWVNKGDLHMDEDFVLRIEKFTTIYQHAQYSPPSQTFYFSAQYIYQSPHARIMRLGDVWCVDVATMPTDMRPDVYFRWDITVRARECPASSFTWGRMP